ncbi:hypothetical protein NP493_419g07018 [Ridgeia piscesae]|uniref:Pyruvate dehydrogenase E1 component subunit alpha n=1 Tax=Ridgeia piscesae TaxID=27915 RepID=A0AAD9L0Y5_RIDPI|nr:hypothetical protein NP493_419g07018 [Ridgeia piscesae]
MTVCRDAFANQCALFQGLLGVLSVRNGSTEQTYDIKTPYKLHGLDEGPSTKATLSHDDALKMYREMTAIRRLETATSNLYKEKLIRGFCHLYSGQEAVAVGIFNTIKPEDGIITSYRAHGWTYLRSMSASCVMAELTGKSVGCSQGKGGSMHMFGDNFFGGNGIVGAQTSIGTGVAFAHKYLGTNNLCVALYGDGAANNGQVFESFNLSKLWDIPVLYVVENNLYGLGTSAERSSASTEYYKRGDYVPGIWMDAMDVLGVREVMRFACDYCRSGKGPIIVECVTYRYFGHSMSDPGTSYRTRDEIQEVRKTRDPITGFKELITTSGLVSADELKKIDGDVKKEMDAAAKVAKTGPAVELPSLYTHVYSTILPGMMIRGPDAYTYGSPK